MAIEADELTTRDDEPSTMSERARRMLEASALVSAGGVGGSQGDSEVYSKTARSSFLRAENEDDDGYDPYSDRPAQHSMWEVDPWN